MRPELRDRPGTPGASRSAVRRVASRGVAAWLAVLSAVVVGAPGPAAAALPALVETDGFELRLGGYASSLSGVQHLPYEAGAALPEVSGLNAAVARLEWRGSLGERVSFEVHDRLFWRLSPAAVAAGNLGLGASVAPERTLDARSVLLDDGGAYLEHDLDRLALRVDTAAADLSLGRQAITWGHASLFPVGDIWTQFSPFEIDTSQKRGVDAVRMLSYPRDGLELDFVAADRGALETASVGVRAAWTLGSADGYAAVAKSWEDVVALMGLAVDLGVLRAHGEMKLGLDPQAGGLQRPRATLGADYVSADLQAGLAYHYNGPGTDEPADYAAAFASPAIARGERYLVGRHYVGIHGAWALADSLRLSAALMANVLDPSAIVVPSGTYLVSQDVHLSVGAYVSAGARPTFEPLPVLRSEFGSYPNLYFAQLSTYF